MAIRPPYKTTTPKQEKKFATRTRRPGKCNIFRLAEIGRFLSRGRSQRVKTGKHPMIRSFPSCPRWWTRTRASRMATGRGAGSGRGRRSRPSTGRKEGPHRFRKLPTRLKARGMPTPYAMMKMKLVNCTRLYPALPQSTEKSVVRKLRGAGDRAAMTRPRGAWKGGGGGRALFEGEGGPPGQSQSGCRAVTGDVKRLGVGAVSGGWKCGWGWCWGPGLTCWRTAGGGGVDGQVWRGGRADGTPDTYQTSALTATELTNSTNRDFGVWKRGGGGMERNGGRRGVGDGEVAGKAHGMWVVAGCGGMWSRKMGEKWDET